MGNCCRTRKKLEGLNASSDQILDKIREVKENLISRFPELGHKSFSKIDDMKSIENITNALIVMATIVEDDFIESTKSLSQEELNQIYTFLLEIEELNKIRSKDYESYKNIFEDHEDLYAKLNINFKVPKLAKFNSSMSTEIDESLLEQPANQKKKI